MSTGEPLGQILRAIRTSRKLSLQSLATRTGLSAVFHSLLERGERNASLETIAAYERLGLNARESWELRRRCTLVEFRKPCADGCTHDASMAPGDGPRGELRDEGCVHCPSCLDVFLSKWPEADESHCPPQCSRRLHKPWHVRFAGNQTSDGHTYSIREE